MFRMKYLPADSSREICGIIEEYQRHSRSDKAQIKYAYN